MKEITADPDLVAHCGLYCGACRAYRKGSCPGCHENEKATGCKVRACCREHGDASCAQCDEFQDPTNCKKFNNFIARLFGFIFRSDRRACIAQIRELGIEGHAEKMTQQGRMTIKP